MLNRVETRVSRPDCPAEAALGRDSRDTRAGRGKARGGLVISAGPGWEGFGGSSRGGGGGPGGWDGAEARRAPEYKQLTEPRGARLASPTAARSPGSHRSQRTEEELPALWALGQSRQTLPLPAPGSAPSTRVPWSTRLSSLSASSRQVFWGANLAEGWPGDQRWGRGLSRGDREISRRALGAGVVRASSVSQSCVRTWI